MDLEPVSGKSHVSPVRNDRFSKIAVPRDSGSPSPMVTNPSAVSDSTSTSWMAVRVPLNTISEATP